MLKRVYRLGKAARTAKGKVYNGQFFNLCIAKNNLLHNRYAFVVSKKVDKRAVVRNKTRRKLSLCIEKMLNKIKTDYDIVFFAKKEAVSQAVRDLCAEVEVVFKKEELLR